MFFKDQPENDDKDADQKHEDRNPVDPVHVFDPGIGGFVRIPLNDIEVFPNFA